MFKKLAKMKKAVSLALAFAMTLSMLAYFPTPAFADAGGVKSEELAPVVAAKLAGDATLYDKVTEGYTTVDLSSETEFDIELYKKLTVHPSGEVFYQFYLTGEASEALAEIFEQYHFVAEEDVVVPGNETAPVDETEPEETTEPEPTPDPSEITDVDYEDPTGVKVSVKMPGNATISVEEVAPLAGTEHWLIWEESVFYKITITDIDGNSFVPENGINVVFPSGTVFNDGDKYNAYVVYNSSEAISGSSGDFVQGLAVPFETTGIVGITKPTTVVEGDADVKSVVSKSEYLTFYDTVYADLVYSAEATVTDADVLTVLGKDTISIGTKTVEVYYVDYSGDNEEINNALDDYCGYVLCSDVEEYVEGGDQPEVPKAPTEEEVQETYEYLFTITTWQEWEEFVNSLTDEMLNALRSLPEDQVAEIERLDAYFYKQKQEELAPPAVDFVEVAPLVFNATAGNTEISVDGLLPVNGVLEVSSINLEQMDKTGYDITDDNNLLAGYDIKITNNDIEWQPEEGETVDVIIDVSSMRLADGTAITVHHEHDGIVTKYDCIVENGTIRFTIDGFSDFILEISDVGEYKYAQLQPYQVAFKSSPAKLYGSHMLLTDYVEVEVDNTDIFVVEAKYIFPDRDVYVVAWENGYLGSKENIKEYIEPTGNTKAYAFMLGSDIRPIGGIEDETVNEVYESLFTIKTWTEWDSYTSELSDEIIAELHSLEDEYVKEIDELDNSFYIEKWTELAPPAVNYTQAAPLAGNASAASPAAYMTEVPAVMSARSATPALMSLTAGTPAVASDIMPVDVTPGNGLELSKTTSAVDSDGFYTINLEAYTTGNVSPGEATPSDIILVLDLSTSMNTKDFDTYTYTAVYSLNTNNTYYLANGQGVTYCSVCKSWNYGCGSRWNHTVGTLVTPKTSASDTNANHVQFYTRRAASDITRLAALKSAMTSFIDTVADQATADNIAIVGFHTNGVRFTGSSNANAFVDATSGETSLKSIISGIDNSDLEAATEHGAGMELADAIFDAQSEEKYTNRNKVVIVVTDGEPAPLNTGNWSSRVVKQAIEEAYELKHDHKATVYSISVMPGTDASNPTSNMDKFMDYMSSNYPNARYTVDDRDNRTSSGYSYYSGSATDIINDITPGTKVTTTGSYYLTASNLDALEGIFGNIAEQTGGASIPLDATTQIKDIVSPYFTLPDGASTEITLTIQDATYTGGTLGWTTSTYTGEQQPVANIVGKNVTVTGFDFAHNFVAENGRVEGDVTKEGNFHGRKLVISFKVKANPDFLGGNNVPSNDSASGVYKANGELVEKFTEPVTDVPIQKINPVLVPQHIYATNTADIDKMISDTADSNTDYRYEYKLGDVIYDFNGTNNKYVNVTYNVYENATGGTPIKTLTILNGQSSGSWNTAEALTEGLTEDKTYYISCTVEPKTTGTYDEVPSDRAPGTVYVYKPTLTFKDSTAYLGGTYPTIDNSNVAKTEWKHSTQGTANTDVMGTAPALTVIYDAPTGVVTQADDVPVNVTSVVRTDNTSVTVPATYAHQNCSGANCTLTNGAELLIHVYSPEITLKDSNVYYGGAVPATDFTGNLVGTPVWSNTTLGNAPSNPAVIVTATNLPSAINTTADIPVTVKVTRADNDNDITANTVIDHSDCVTDENEGTADILLHVFVPSYTFKDAGVYLGTTVPTEKGVLDNTTTGGNWTSATGVSADNLAVANSPKLDVEYTPAKTGVITTAEDIGVNVEIKAGDLDATGVAKLTRGEHASSVKDSEFVLHVFKPVLPFADITAYYGDVIDITDSFDATEVTWTSDVPNLEKLTGAPDAPTAFDYDAEWANGVLVQETGDQYVVNSATDIPVNVVNVTVGNAQIAPAYVELTHINCTEGETMPDYAQGDKAEFVVHVNTVSLDVSKNVEVVTTSEKFDVTVTYTGKVSAPSPFENNVAQVTLGHGDTSAFTNLPVGNYVVTEVTQSSKYVTTTKVDEGNFATTNVARIRFDTTADDFVNYHKVTFNNKINVTSLTIHKDVDKDGASTYNVQDSFIFNVYKVVDGKETFYMRVALQDNKSVTIPELIVGDTYVVKEESDWSWRYGDVADVSATLEYDATPDNPDTQNEANFTNKATGPLYWLDNESHCENLFN